LDPPPPRDPEPIAEFQPVVDDVYAEPYGQDYAGTYDDQGRQMEADPNDEWVSYFDKDSNSLYYYNNYTGESAWELPPGCKLAYE
jgi:hypothetical protein